MTGTVAWKLSKGLKRGEERRGIMREQEFQESRPTPNR